LRCMRMKKSHRVALTLSSYTVSWSNPWQFSIFTFKICNNLHVFFIYRLSWWRTKCFRHFLYFRARCKIRPEDVRYEM